MIPEERQAAVARGLSEAFGVTEFDEIRPLAGGMSTALIYRIVVKARPYLLRLISHTGALGDPTREFACMKLAAEAGVAPRAWYANAEDRILISDFVETKPYPADAAQLIARTLRKLHGVAEFQFPKVVNYFDAVDGFIRRFKTAKLMPESATEEVFRCYAEMMNVYPRNDADLVSCHNDLKPQNILFDGERVWLVDWEAAFLNDRYSDLAIAAGFFVEDEAAEENYLRAYFGEPANEYQRSRFFLMRQVIHMSYAMLFMTIGAAAGAKVDADVQAPDFREFHQRILSGEIDTVSAETKVRYARAHLHRFQQNMRTERFERAMAVVGAHSNQV